MLCSWLLDTGTKNFALHTGVGLSPVFNGRSNRERGLTTYLAPEAEMKGFNTNLKLLRAWKLVTLLSSKSKPGQEPNLQEIYQKGF